MSDTPRITPALTPEEWAEEVSPSISLNDRMLWACDEAQLGRDQRHALAALALHGQPFGFTREDVDLLRYVATNGGLRDASDVARLDLLADRIAALLPPP